MIAVYSSGTRCTTDSPGWWPPSRGSGPMATVGPTADRGRAHTPRDPPPFCSSALGWTSAASPLERRGYRRCRETKALSRKQAVTRSFSLARPSSACADRSAVGLPPLTRPPSLPCAGDGGCRHSRPTLLTTASSAPIRPLMCFGVSTVPVPPTPVHEVRIFQGLEDLQPVPETERGTRPTRGRWPCRRS